MAEQFHQLQMRLLDQARSGYVLDAQSERQDIVGEPASEHSVASTGSVCHDETQGGMK
jgi:hypothetical protein